MNSSRQKKRFFFQLLFFLLFPLTIWYFSPYLILMGASEGIATGSFFVFIGLFVSALFFGRFFCSWICPVGFLGDALLSVTDKKVGKRLKYVKYSIWIPWLAAIVYFFIRAGGVRTVNVLYMTDRGISVKQPEDYYIYYTVIGLSVIFPWLLGKRGACHTICWMAPFMILGRSIRNLFKWPALQRYADKSKCIQCGRCTQNCPMSLEVMTRVQNGQLEDADCIQCGLCVDTCPKGVLSLRFGRAERIRSVSVHRS